MDFRQFLEMKYLEYQRDSGGRKTVNDFARYLGFSQSTISTWWNGNRIPQGENIHKLSLRLGLEVYDALGLPRPDPELHYIQQHWDVYSPEERRALLEQAKTYSVENERIRRQQAQELNQQLFLQSVNIFSSIHSVPIWLQATPPTEVNHVLKGFLEKIIVHQNRIELVVK